MTSRPLAVTVDCNDVELGASRLADDPEHPWVLLADPEGNEFCMLPPR